MLLQASIEMANAERWALEIGDHPVPASLQQNLRRAAYEVTVVDAVHRIARRYFERHGYLAIWERSFQTGRRGRPETVDIALLDANNQREIRIELGLYSKPKLSDDANKLAKLTANAVPGFETIDNLVMLWEISASRLTRAQVTAAMQRFRTDSTSVAIAGGGQVVTPLLASSVDLFVAQSGSYRFATVGLFILTASVPVAAAALAAND